MIFLRAVLSAFAVFSRFPVPKSDWNEQNMRYMMAAFPLVGAAIGLLLFGWVTLCNYFNLGAMLTACGMTLIPIAATGAIHLDGFCDTTDALASRAEPAKKREILKDPHIGAFAAIGLAGYLLLYFALCYALAPSNSALTLLFCVHILSRVCSALATIFLSGAGGAGMLHSFSEYANKRVTAAVLMIMLAICAAAMLLISAAGGALILLTALLCYLRLAQVAQKEFGGMRGDLAGWFLQCCELLCLAALVIIQKGGWL